VLDGLPAMQCTADNECIYINTGTCIYTNVPNESVKCFFLIEHNITYRYYVLHDMYLYLKTKKSLVLVRWYTHKNSTVVYK